MKLMNKFMKKREGFTLVELIVVIAILAILAGVAVPVYSGYIKKANSAADLQLLDAVNSAFAAACINNGYDHVKARGTTLAVNADGTVATANGTGGYTYGFAFVYSGGTVDAADAAIVIGDFGIFFAGNETAAFKGEDYVGKVLILDANGQFAAGSGAYDNLTFDPDLITLVQNSAFLTASGLGVDTLLDKVDYITNLAARLADQTQNDGAGNGAWQMLSRYNQKMFDDLGIVIPENFDELSDDEKAAVMAPLQTLVNDKINVLNGQNIDGWNEMTANEKNQYAQNQILANYAVLDAAKQMQGQNASDVLDTIKDTSNFTNLIKESDSGVSNAAAAYGLYTAYAYSIPDPDAREAAIAKANDPVALLKAMDDDGFRAYLDTPAAEDDLAGYMAAMEMVDSSASDEEAIHHLMVNGFTDPELLAAIQGALG